MGIDTYDIRVTMQSITLLVMVIVAISIIAYRIKYGYLSRSLWGVCALVIHIIIFYTCVLLAEFDIFDAIAFVQQALHCDLISYGTWSSAIRLQTAIELLLMTLTVAWRRSWINSVLKS